MASPRPMAGDIKSRASNAHAPVAMMGQRQISASSAVNDRALSDQSTTASEPPRELPAKDVKAETVEDDYVQFIFYCNPSLPPSLDTAELRRGFQSMPKTDGKTFNIFALFELIQKLEAKEIETWSQLVVDMGVAPPDVASGQSTQKVQQYAVRLKRWLHAYHIDAFFQYCLDKPNSYYTEISPSHEVATSSLRDGVPAEEDLALRALVPELRPKRGRRPNDEGLPSPGVKRPLRAAPWAEPANPMSAYPQSASPWDRESNQRDPWAAAHRAIAPRPGQALTPTPQSSHEPPPFDNGQLNFYMDLQEPNTHPQSAVSSRPPLSAFPTSTPQSAHPTSSRSRKRHGPSVSAAWGSEGSSGGKLRGRPPANRTVQDGPFSTFPARQSPTPASATPTSIPSGPPQPSSTGSPFGRSPPQVSRKPSKLQLQVPQHAGGPVRLATPPPKVLLNGTEGATGHRHERRTSADFFNIDDDPSELGDSGEDGNGDEVNWKRRALNLQRKVRELEAELKNVKKRVLEAVM